MPLLALDGPLDLQATLRGGQAFRWSSDVGAHLGTARGHRFRLATVEGRLRWEADPREGAEEALRTYLGVGAGHAAALSRLRRDPLLAEAATRYPGLRLLDQDPWEATAAFVLSQNNNVRRLEGLLPRVAAAAGTARDGPLGPWHAFPEPAAVAALGEAGLRRLGCGYRAPYLAGVAEAVARDEPDLRELRKAPLEAARASLTTLPGVGRKVADCILLYALGRREVFPVDRWIHRWLVASGVEVAPGDPEDAGAFARERWGADAGLAQQLLFHAARLGDGTTGVSRSGR